MIWNIFPCRGCHRYAIAREGRGCFLMNGFEQRTPIPRRGVLSMKMFMLSTSSGAEMKLNYMNTRFSLIAFG